MKYIQFFIVFFMCLVAIPARAQLDSITILDEIFLTDTKLRDFSTGQTVLKISDSATKRTRPLLTSVLNFNTPLYFKENGLGMVSSPAFRGTTASQTAVLWNGININSQFNGQIDFNTINAAGYDDIGVRGGGGSVAYGTGAIGGTVHLNTNLSFREKLENDLFLQYGSFNTIDARYRLKAAWENWSISVAGAHNSSDNDYDRPDGRENLNGQFYNNSLNLGMAYRFNHRNILKFYSELFDGERHFSLIRPSETRTKYRDFNNRSMLEWESRFSGFTSIAKVAFLDENYRYYENVASENYSFGEAESFIGRYDLEFSGFDKLQFNAVLSNTYTNGKGSSLGENSRNIFSAALLMKHRLSESFTYEAGLRKEATSNYESPLLFSAGGRYRFSEFYSLKLNGSRNFRIPTYNDLYWTSSGNTDLKPETSMQAEVGNSFNWKGLGLDITAYYINIKDMIQWVPGNGGIWRPRNQAEVRSYGLESFLRWNKELDGDQYLSLSATYAYTISENQNTGNQLIYVPFHKTTAAVAYTCGRWEMNYQVLYNGEVFTRSDNDRRYSLDPYTISNIATSYGFGSGANYRLGARVLNLFDEAYESVENRWMPGINFNIYLNLNF